MCYYLQNEAHYKYIRESGNMKIDNIGDLIEHLGVLLGIVGFIFGSITIMYIGAILCLLRNSYDLLFGKVLPVINFILMLIFYLMLKNIALAITYGTIVGSGLEVVIINIIRITKRKVYNEPLNK